MVARYFFQCLICYDFLNLFTYFLFKNLPVKGVMTNLYQDRRTPNGIVQIMSFTVLRMSSQGMQRSG